MAFHYQNLIQEKDFNYNNFEERYKAIKKYSISKLKEFKSKNHIIAPRHVWECAKRSSNNPIYEYNGKEYKFNNRQEKILIITNILFPDENYFLQKFFKYNVELENCFKLKCVLNELDRNDKDFLDGTMEGLVRYYIESFDSIAKDLQMSGNNEFIIYKLMEIIYFSPELLEKTKQK